MRMHSLGAVLLVAMLGGTGVVMAAGTQEKAGERATAGDTINLNTATVAQLETLPGIGRRTAERIVEYRQKQGGFKKIEELMNVKGIGEKSFLKLKPRISVGSKADKPSGA